VTAERSLAPDGPLSQRERKARAKTAIERAQRHGLASLQDIIDIANDITPAMERDLTACDGTFRTRTDRALHSRGLIEHVLCEDGWYRGIKRTWLGDRVAEFLREIPF
jgi:hypothetical protein